MERSRIWGRAETRTAPCSEPFSLLTKTIVWVKEQDANGCRTCCRMQSIDSLLRADAGEGFDVVLTYKTGSSRRGCASEYSGVIVWRRTGLFTHAVHVDTNVFTIAIKPPEYAKPQQEKLGEAEPSRTRGMLKFTRDIYLFTEQYP